MTTTRYAILEPPLRWTEDEPPGPTLVIRSSDDGDTWHEIAACQSADDAEEICWALEAIALERAERAAEEHARLMAELDEERWRP